MRQAYLILLLCSVFPCCAADFDNPYAEYYTSTVAMSDDYGNPYMQYYNRLSELVSKYHAARAREQSAANKLLGAAAIGLGGIGGMQLMSGLAEQKADQDAARDMKAYLATFACDYGAGRNIKGGETEIALPTGDNLMAIKTEYLALAADLKTRKEALDISPGIEAEVVSDSAATGLYNNAGTGKTEGAYTSISRALLDENSADAAAWREQTSAAQDKTKTGLKVGGAGVVGGTVGNLIETATYNKKQ